MASNDLLHRLGKGDEQKSKKEILSWQRGDRRNKPPKAHLETRHPVVDDEMYADVN